MFSAVADAFDRHLVINIDVDLTTIMSSVSVKIPCLSWFYFGSPQSVGFGLNINNIILILIRINKRSWDPGQRLHFT